jgi:nitrite reductase/ring-hydroxylating ferredoxin subunit
MHGYEYDIFSGKLEYIPPKWTDQSPKWIKSKDLKLFPVLEKEGSIYVEM